MLHEALLLLFRNRPSLAPDLLANTLGVVLPQYTEARLQSAELNQVVPTEYRADLVVLLLHDAPVLAIVVEAQLANDADKRWSWPVYLSTLRASLRCGVLLFVVTADEATARWAAEPIPLGHPGFFLTPFVLGPGLVPIVTDPVVADADPELAVLSAMAHGSDDPALALRVAVAAISAAGRLDDERAKLYIDLVLSRVRGAAKAALEELMQSGKYEYQSDFARKYIAMGVAQGKAEGVVQGKAEGVAQGKAEGVVQGKAEGLATSVLNVLAARGLDVPEGVRARVLGCDDVPTLERWVTRAVTAPSAGALLDEPR